MNPEQMVHDDTKITRYGHGDLPDGESSITAVTPAQMLDEILHVIADNPYIINDLDHQLPIAVDFRPGDSAAYAKRTRARLAELGAPPFPLLPSKASISTWAYEGDDPEKYEQIATFTFDAPRPFGQVGVGWEESLGAL